MKNPPFAVSDASASPGDTSAVQPVRRRLIRGAAVAGAALALPGLAQRAFAQAKPTELTMLAWYGHAEKDVVAEFEAQHNVKIRPKYYVGGDNMLALISQSPPGTYDLIQADAEYVQQLVRAGHVERLQPADYPFDDFFPEFHRFPGHWDGDKLYAVMIRFGFLGVAYNTTAVSEKEARSYKVYADPKFKGRVGHFDWHLPSIGQASLLDGQRKPFDIDAAAWGRVQQQMMGMRRNVGGFFDYGGTFASLRNGQMVLMAGIGDWITGVLEKNGASVRTVLPDEGGLQWTESFSIGKGSRKAELARAFIQYMASPPGQVRSATMQAYPALVPNRKGWELLAQQQPQEAKRSRMEPGKRNAMDDIREGRITNRALPVRQSLEDWSDFWSRYKNA
ncbi:spermidine/putrescine transport system substrate-binding protein [Variovorax sp. PDC80]|uniref:polyamine ABC transporter substrate-binding protein n=1 Tax=Variovorax sp. PDC80 TaxID=1882827 RepID=UPI0008ED9B04|nr:spermidine/putrescine ABC transporter substrate-binding protein [Variovorax sp. PDC80]SFQ04512.1 spermidine/putrescine transport system substrate-binding protein [Variovorax sp. PDC80]